VRKDQGKASLCVVGDRECRWAPFLHCVAAFAAPAAGTFGKLATVRIGLMAVGAAVVRNRRFKISGLVTTDAGNLDVLAEQGITGFRVIEALGKTRFCPGGSSVAGIASLLERRFVRIAVAFRTACKGQAGITRLAVWPGRVATLALNEAVLSGERIPSLRVVESCPVDVRGLPIGCGMATCAVRAEAALMRVFVACCAAR